MKKGRFTRHFLNAVVFFPVLGIGWAYGQCNCSCVLVLGFSQTRSWFGGENKSKFEGAIEDESQWQLIYAGGARVDKWTSPSFEGWRAKVKSPCKKNSKSPDKALLTVSGNHGTDVGKWKSDTEKFIAVLRRKYPSVTEVILQPVVGDHENCRVRASRQHPSIQKALEQVAESDPAVVMGFDPHVRSCKDFSDGTGHLTSSAQKYIGVEIAKFYNSFWESGKTAARPGSVRPGPDAAEAIAPSLSVSVRGGDLLLGYRFVADVVVTDLAGTRMGSGVIPANGFLRMSRPAPGRYLVKVSGPTASASAGLIEVR